MKKFAVFDIDGTLIRWQLYHTIVDRLAKGGLLGGHAVKELHEARMRWKRREAGYSFRDYEWTLITTYEKALPNVSPTAFDTLVSGIIEEYKDQVYTFTRDLAATLKKKGYTLLAISGSHEELVAEVAKHYGFDDWAGTRYERQSNKFTGQKFVASHHKETVLRQLIKKHNLTFEHSYAVGDSKSDVPMLEMVQRPVAFNPDRELYAIALEKRWQIVIERKNVVYRLEPHRKEYTLTP